MPAACLSLIHISITLALLAGPLAAASLGNLRTVSATAATATAAPGWDIVTSNGSRLRIEVLRRDVIHVQASRNDVLSPAGDKAAPIVLPQPVGGSIASLEEDAKEIRIRTDALVLSLIHI